MDLYRKLEAFEDKLKAWTAIIGLPTLGFSIGSIEESDGKDLYIFSAILISWLAIVGLLVWKLYTANYYSNVDGKRYYQWMEILWNGLMTALLVIGCLLWAINIILLHHGAVRVFTGLFLGLYVTLHCWILKMTYSKFKGEIPLYDNFGMDVAAHI